MRLHPGARQTADGARDARATYNDDMSEPIVVSDDVRVPERALTVRAVRASGPGGQNVNKVATKIDLRVDLDAIEGLSDAARARLAGLARHRLDAAGRLVVTSQVTRNQARNLEDARDKVRALVRAALVRPRARRPTRPGAAAGERRLAEKKRRGEVKRRRGRVADAG
jgi:ribosome-associated protein